MNTGLPVKKTLLIVMLGCASSAYPQLFSAGIKAGFPTTSELQGDPSGSYVRPYIVGLTGEIRLRRQFSLEADILYRRSGFGASFDTYAFGAPPFPPFLVVQRSRVNDWQIPLLGKWESGVKPFQPFIDAGISYRHISGGSVSDYFSLLGPSSSQSTAATTKTFSTGATVGGGLELKLLRLRVSPELRYTRWFSPPYIGNYLPIRMSANQIDLLIGFTF